MTAANLFLPTHCVVCGSPTGLCTAAQGDADWLVSFLVFLGLVKERAERVVSTLEATPPLGDRIAVVLAICGQCALRAGVPTAFWIPGSEVPVTRQAEEDRP